MSLTFKSCSMSLDDEGPVGTEMSDNSASSTLSAEPFRAAPDSYSHTALLLLA